MDMQSYYEMMRQQANSGRNDGNRGRSTGTAKVSKRRSNQSGNRSRSAGKSNSRSRSRGRSASNGNYDGARRSASGARTAEGGYRYYYLLNPNGQRTGQVFQAQEPRLAARKATNAGFKQIILYNPGLGRVYWYSGRVQNRKTPRVLGHTDKQGKFIPRLDKKGKQIVFRQEAVVENKGYANVENNSAKNEQNRGIAAAIAQMVRAGTGNLRQNLPTRDRNSGQFNGCCVQRSASRSAAKKSGSAVRKSGSKSVGAAKKSGSAVRKSGSKSVGAAKKSASAVRKSGSKSGGAVRKSGSKSAGAAKTPKRNKSGQFVKGGGGGGGGATKKSASKTATQGSKSAGAANAPKRSKSGQFVKGGGGGSAVRKSGSKSAGAAKSGSAVRKSGQFAAGGAAKAGGAGKARAPFRTQAISGDGSRQNYNMYY